MTEQATEGDGLTKRFDEVTAFDGLDLRIESGEIVCFLGPSGAGKSTTINVLPDLLAPTAGTASTFGSDVAADRDGTTAGSASHPRTTASTAG